MDTQDNRGQWFVIQTLSGQENKVREALTHEMDQGDSVPVYEVSIPSEVVAEVRNGKKSTLKRKRFPGYIFVRMDLYDVMGGVDEAAWYFIRNVQGVIGFVGGGKRPAPLSENEVADLVRQSEMENQEIPKVAYEVGETVRVKSGAFENFEGVVDEIDNERGKLKLMVSIFGRSTPVELEFWQVDREIQGCIVNKLCKQRAKKEICEEALWESLRSKESLK